MKKAKQYLLCVSDKGNESSLVVRKVYEQIPDPDSEKHGMIRVVDEDGEDYAFPAQLFVAIALPKAATRALRRAA